MAQSAFEHDSATEVMAEVRNWIDGRANKKQVFDIAEDVANEAEDWEKTWFKWFHALPAPIDKQTQNRVNASQEPLFIYYAALALGVCPSN